MDARLVDRPAAVMRGTGVGLDRAVVEQLTQWGYDVHFPADLLPAVAEVPHPRLHPGSGSGVGVEAGSVPGTLAEVRRDRGSPLALITCSRPCDVAAQLGLLSRFMAPLRTSGLLVLDGTLDSRSVSPVPLPATLDPRILLSTVPAGGDATWVRRATGSALDQLLTRVTR